MSGGEFAEIEARAAAATGGPWTWTEHRVPTLEGVVPSEFYSYSTEVLDATHSGECGCRSACELELEVSPADAEFIAHAREDVPALLAAVRERDNTIAKVQTLLRSWDNGEYDDMNQFSPHHFVRHLRAALDPQETE